MNGSVEYLPATVIRVRSDAQFLDEIGPDAFTLIVSTPIDSPEGLKVYASASAKPFTGKAAAETLSEVVRAFKRVASLEPLDPSIEIEQWELMLMAVDVSLQRQGIAGKVMALSKLKEINFEYYIEKGVHGGVYAGGDDEEVGTPLLNRQAFFRRE